MKKKYLNVVQKGDRVDHSATYKMTHKFCASVTFPLKFHHYEEVIFLVFRVYWEARGMACGPCFFGFKRCTTSCYSSRIHSFFLKGYIL